MVLGLGPSLHFRRGRMIWRDLGNVIDGPIPRITLYFIPFSPRRFDHKFDPNPGPWKVQVSTVAAGDHLGML